MTQSTVEAISASFSSRQFVIFFFAEFAGWFQ